MNDYGRLAYTGLGTITVGGVMFDQLWIAGIAAVLIVGGVTAIRVGWRRDRAVNHR
jgi:hypothetical protein